MIDAWILLFSLITGLGMGILFFLGLWWTVSGLATSRHPWLRVFLSFIGRTIIVLTGFYYLLHMGVVYLGVAVVGFLVARSLLTRWKGPEVEHLNPDTAGEQS